MVEVRVIENENARLRKSLEAALEKAKERLAAEEGTHYEVGYYGGDLDYGTCHAYLFIREVKKARWLGLIPFRKRRTVFAVNDAFYGGAYGKKEINCYVYDIALFVPIKEEIEKCAQAVGATNVSFRKTEG